MYLCHFLLLYFISRYCLTNCQSLIINKFFIWNHIRAFCLGEDQVEVDLGTQEAVEKLSAKHSVIAGFKFKSLRLLKQHKSRVVNQLMFQKNYYELAEAFINRVKKEHGCIIGVHIRIGDRKNDPNIETCSCFYKTYETSAITGYRVCSICVNK